MELGNSTTFQQAGGMTETSEFKINADSSKLFEILRNSMYTDKITAPIREYVCNALDAHRACNQVRPFDIYIPNSNVPEWVIRDYGIGLTHEQVKELYTTYLSSTKDQSNDFIGGFGIGSKSAFAYTDTFTIINYTGKDVIRYSCYINDDNTSSISVVDKRPPENEDEKLKGIEVRIPVRVADFKEFANKTIEVLKPINEKMFTAHNFVAERQKYSAVYDEFSIRENRYWGDRTTTRVRMGDVMYDVPDSFWDKFSNTHPDIGGSNTFIRIDIDFDIGELSISPSREQISLDRKTTDRLTAKLVKIYKDQTSKYVARLSKTRGIINTAKEYMKIIRETSSADSIWLPNKGFQFATYMNRGSVKGLNLWNRDKVVMYELEGPRGGPPRAATTSSENYHVSPYNVIVCSLDDSRKTPVLKALAEVRKEAKEIAEAAKDEANVHANGMVVALVGSTSDLAELRLDVDIKLDGRASRATAGRAKSTAGALFYRDYGGSSSRTEASQMDPSKKFYYAEGKRGDAPAEVPNHVMAAAENLIYRVSDQLTATPLYIVPPTHMHAVKNFKNAIPHTEFAKEFEGWVVKHSDLMEKAKYEYALRKEGVDLNLRKTLIEKGVYKPTKMPRYHNNAGGIDYNTMVRSIQTVLTRDSSAYPQPVLTAKTTRILTDLASPPDLSVSRDPEFMKWKEDNKAKYDIASRFLSTEHILEYLAKN